jgi:hypothetical protein
MDTTPNGNRIIVPVRSIRLFMTRSKY